MSEARKIATARLAAADGSASDCAVDHDAVVQLLRCARLSENADHTLEWALKTLSSRFVSGRERADGLACAIVLRALLARLEADDHSVAPVSEAVSS